MKAKSEEYIRLQMIYKTKARKDVESVMNILKKLASENAVLHALNVEGLRSEVVAFCKCAGHVKVLQGLGPLFQGLTYHREAAGKISKCLYMFAIPIDRPKLIHPSQRLRRRGLTGAVMVRFLHISPALW